MNTSNAITEARSNSLADNPINRVADGTSTPSAASGTTGTGKQQVAISSFAQQLSDAALRAAARDGSLDRQALAAKGKHLTNIIAGPNYWAKKKIHDAEIPKTDDPLHLARARQATAYTNQEGPNPFKGMNREQLSLIAYDESGTFTVNERRAAWSEAYRQDEAQRRILVEKMMDEYNRTGKIVDSLVDVLKFYKSLPAIEQAMQLPVDYEAQLMSRILAGGSAESLGELTWLGLETELNFNGLGQSKNTNSTPKLF